MANRKRGVFSLPEELRTDERLTTKKELAQRRQTLCPCPPVPNKIRKHFFTSNVSFDKPRPLCFSNSVTLSPMYDSSLNSSYFEQIFTKQHLIGEGSFGKVYRARSKVDNEWYAIKRLKPMISRNDRYAEVKNNEKVGVHPNCVRFYMAWEESSDVYMLLEYCDMSLSDFSVLNNDISEDLLWNVLYDMCRALDYLHGKCLLHLDVKPGNIMMNKGYYKLGDFGILVDLKLEPTICKSTLSDGDSKYLALEVLEGVYKPSCDIFGLGISLLELAADLELPSNGPLWQQLRHEVLPQAFYDRVSLGFKVIIERMLKPQHEQRPSADKILKFCPLRSIEKRDRKTPRVDYAIDYTSEKELNDQKTMDLELPVVVINNNNILDTPPCTHDYNKIDVLENSNHFIGRKSLFHTSPKNKKHTITLDEMNNMLEASLNSQDSLPLLSFHTEESIQIASELSDSRSRSLGDSCMEVDLEAESMSGSSSSLHIFCDELITSTPNLKIRKIPKTRLSFD